jgi:pyruvyltransferase
MRNFLLKIYDVYRSFIFNYEKNIPLFWFKGKKNFGDEINYFLVTSISKKNVQWVNPKYFLNIHFFCIGSILERAQTNSIIWGSGFLDCSSKVIKPKTIYSVRGPRTRQKYLDNNIECPEIYGDPALLLPIFYKPLNDKKKYKIGVIPHYVDKEIAKKMAIFQTENVKVIDIQQDDLFGFIDEVVQCEFIFSSSLHGLIVADAYKIKNIWVRFSNDIRGGEFKFFDYFESIKRNTEKCCIITNETSFEEIFSYQKDYNIQFNQEALLKACPFNILSHKNKE